MLDNIYIGKRFHVEILPNYEFNSYCENDHKENRVTVDKMSLYPYADLGFTSALRSDFSHEIRIFYMVFNRKLA